MKKSHQAIIV